MFEYINGKVTIIESGYIVIDNNGIGYKIFVGSPYSFNIDEEYIKILEKTKILYLDLKQKKKEICF